MDYIKVEFSIKDLENLSGVKAHTIRIWEQRYQLLEPNRSDSNIRSYSIVQLQKLLNISLLNNNGFKVSKIAELTESEIVKATNQLNESKDTELNKYVNKFILSMVGYDLVLFEKTYNNCIREFSFTEVFTDIFIPLLEKVGLLWQTSSINPTHEHFISNLIRQKLYSHIEKLQINDWSDDTLYVLFLPLNEIHDIGLLYLQYELLARQKRTIFLGSSIEIEHLNAIQKLDNSRVVYISYLTTKPDEKGKKLFIEQLNTLVNDNDFVILGGRKAPELEINYRQIKILHYLKDLDQLIDN